MGAARRLAGLGGDPTITSRALARPKVTASEFTLGQLAPLAGRTAGRTGHRLISDPVGFQK